MRIGRGSAPYAVAVVVVATAGCAALSGVTDLTVVDDAGMAADSAAAEASAPPSSTGSSGSVPSGSPDSSPDAVVDAASLDGEAGAGASTVRCNGVECPGRCCLAQSGTAECVPNGQSCSEEMIALSCDERADCPPSQQCCLRFSGTAQSVCAESCAPGTETLCRTDDECTGTDDCLPLEEIGFPPMHGRGACE
jgi:hypothetical protein